MSDLERKRLALRQAGNANFHKLDKVSADIFALTYGALVKQILQDYETIPETNKMIHKLGYSIGTRIVDEFLAKANINTCQNFMETAEIIAKVAFKMFLGVHVDVAEEASSDQFTLKIAENPLAELVELPEEYILSPEKLQYSGLLCGVIRGALEMVGMRVECSLKSDTLWGDEITEIQVTLIEMIADEYIDPDE